MLFSNDKFFGYDLYYSSFDGVEPFHAHASQKQREAGSAKLWIYEDGYTKIAHKGAVNDKTLSAVQDWIKINIEVMKIKGVNARNCATCNAARGLRHRRFYFKYFGIFDWVCDYKNFLEIKRSNNMEKSCPGAAAIN